MWLERDIVNFFLTGCDKDTTLAILMYSDCDIAIVADEDLSLYYRFNHDGHVLEEKYGHPFYLYIIDDDKFDQVAVEELVGPVRVLWRRMLMKDCNVIDNDKDVGFPGYTYHPYLRMRGKPVTREQAIDIVSRTDEYFVKNKYFPYIDDMCGIVHKDGFIGYNGSPFAEDLQDSLESWLTLKALFPYLDYIVAVTYWPTYPMSMHEDLPVYREEEGEETAVTDSPNWELQYIQRFLNCLDCGFWIHGDKIEILGAERARQVYSEYNTSDEAVYTDHGLFEEAKKSYAMG